MGCASSKPSNKTKKSKDKENKENNNNNSNTNKKQTSPQHQPNESNNKQSDESIRLDRNLVDQIAQNENRIIEYIVRLVSRDFEHDLARNSSTKKAASQIAQENYDLATDITSKAVHTLKSESCPRTYKLLGDKLKQSPYLCKNQVHKNHLCDLTVNKIKECLDTINNDSGHIRVSDFLNAHEEQHQQLTPPQTPDKQQQQQQPTPNNATTSLEDKAVLLSRTQANELARILFLSSRARPVVHASPKVKDAYYVNKQLTDNSEVTVSKKEIEDILHKFDEPFIFQIKNLSYELNTPPSPLHNNHTSQPQSNSSTPFITIHQKSINTNLLRDLNNNNSLNEEPSLTTVTHMDTTNQTNNNAQNDTTIEYENVNLNDSAVSNDGDHDKDLRLAAVAVLSAMAASAAQDSSGGSNTNNDLFSDEDFVKTTVVNTTFTTTTITNDNETTVDTEMVSSEQVQTVHADDDENGSLEPILKQSLLDDRFYNNHSFKTEPPVNGERSNDAATQIQSEFRSHITREELAHQQHDVHSNAN